MMEEDLNDFAQLKGLRSYQKLQLIWAKQGKDILDSLNKASKEKSKDETLRWNAGVWYGFDLAIAALDRALKDLQEKMGSDKTSNVDELLKRVEEQQK